MLSAWTHRLLSSTEARLQALLVLGALAALPLGLVLVLSA